MAETDFLSLNFFTIFVFWAIQAFSQILNWIYWLQTKEYRWDRFSVFFKSYEGVKKLGILFIFFKILTAFFLKLYPVGFLFLIGILYLDFLTFWKLFTKNLKKPVFTQRAQKIFLASVLGILATLFFRNLLVGEVLLLVTPFLGILWTTPIVNKIKREEIKKAREVLDSVKPIVIGITGSYGKTTTKEFVAHLLSQKFKVAKTEGSENTEFGVARKAILNVKSGTEFFVVEMGAYKRGEIKKLTEIVHPSIGILTGIEEQHLALFGSLENIKKAKFELIESLPQEGLAIFNFNNKHCRELFLRAKKLKSKLKVLSYFVKHSTQESWDENADIVARVLSFKRKSIVFEVKYKSAKHVFSTNLTGEHLLENLTAGILVAKLFGVSWKKIEEGVKNLVLPKGTMNVYELGGNIIIDDTYNSTPSSFEAAINYLKSFKNKRRIVITSGIIELGQRSGAIHQKIGKLLSGKAEIVYLTNRDFLNDLKKGMTKKDKLIYVNEDKLYQIVKGILNSKDSVVLLEGRLPAKIMLEFSKKI